MIDTHAHLLKEYYDDLDEVIINSLKDIKYIFNIAFSIESSKEVIELSKKYKNLPPVIGIHPNNVDSLSESWEDELEELIKKNLNRIAAIGEIGLDFHYHKNNIEKQKEVFIKQIELANKYGLPVVIHSREANVETIEIVFNYRETKFLFHSWSGDIFQTLKLNSRENIWYSFNGISTFKNAEDNRETMLFARRDRILLETDSPYLTPHPYRGKKNTPLYLKYIYENAYSLYFHKENDIDENALEFFNV